MLYQLSYEVNSVRVGDISELSLVPSISVFHTQVKIYGCDVVSEYVHTGQTEDGLLDRGGNRTRDLWFVLVHYITHSNRLDS
jgi:hypothetical protein